MVLTRVITFCSISMLIGGCSHLLREPAQYASIPSTSITDKVGGTIMGADVVIPGTSTIRSFSQRGRSIDPLSVLQRSASAYVDREKLRMDKLTERPSPFDPSQKAARFQSTLEPTSTASLHTLDKGAIRYPSENYDRQATMNRLVKGGQDAAKPICIGC